jgi:hypothetical protein
VIDWMTIFHCVPASPGALRTALEHFHNESR